MMQELIAKLRRHRTHPNAPDYAILQLEDIIKTFEYLAASSTPEGLEKRMTDLENALTAAVADLGAKLTAHDTQVQASLAALSAASAAGDQTAVKAAVDAIAQASSKIASETTAMAAAMVKPDTTTTTAAPVADAATSDPAAAPAPGTAAPTA